MADDTLRMRAQVVDEFSSPLRKLKSELASVKPPADLARIRDGLKGLEQHSFAAGRAIRDGVGAALSGIGISAIGVTAAIGGAAAALKNFATGTAELRHFSVEIGLSVNRLRELQALGQRFGVDENSMLGGLKKFSNELFDIRRRRGAAYEELLKAGPGGAELAERLVGSKSVEEAVGRALGFLERIPNAVQRQRLAETLFGNGMFGRLGEGGPGSIGKLLAEIGKTIGQTSAQGVEAAKQFEEQFAKLRETLQGVGNDIGVKLLPVLSEKMRELGASLKEVDWKGFANEAELALRSTMEIVKAVAEVVKGIGLILRHDFSPIIGEKGYKGALGSPLIAGRPEAGTPGHKARTEYLEEKRAELEKRVEAYRQKGDKASEIGAQTKLDQIVEELRKLREGAERGAQVQQQSFGGTGFGGLIHNASYGGGGFSRGAPMYRPPAGVAPERNAPMVGAVSPRSGGGAGPIRVNPLGSGRAADAVDLMKPLEGMHERFNGGAIDSFLKQGGVNIRSAYVAWCAAFVNSALNQVGVKGDGSLVAADFRKWGAKVNPEDVRKGDVLVDHRGRQPGQTGAHVGMATGRTRMRNGQLEIEMLSGNESDKVQRSFYRAGGLDIRRALESYSINRKQLLADAAPSSNGATRIGDDLMRRNFPAQKVEGNASLHIQLEGFPRGTKATPDASGMFKTIQLDRGRQMDGIDV